MQLRCLHDLFVARIGALLSAEQQLVEALPKLAAAASNDELRRRSSTTSSETRDHVRRLEEIFGQARDQRSGETCAAMQGLIPEDQEIITAQGARRRGTPA